ncbi:MAG: outer membrane beta-barrel protein [Pseudomonadota bacterium]
MRSAAALAATVTILTAGAAAAQGVIPLDTSSAPPPVPTFTPTYDWNGFYLGGTVGFANGDVSGASDDDSVIGGFRLGYDADLGNYVIGGRVDYEFTDIGIGDGEVDGIFRVGARVGFDSGRDLFYGIGGYADTDTDDVGSGDGFFVGGGYETFLTEQITLGAEVLYHDLEGFGGGTDLEATTATVGVNFRF